MTELEAAATVGARSSLKKSPPGPEVWESLARLGFSLFPLVNESKRPAVKWEQWRTAHASSEDLGRWASAVRYNIGIATGAVSGCVVLDLDNSDALAEAERLGLPDTIAVRTPRGRHVYFAHPGGTVQNRVELLPGTDLRGDGGYVVGPGSYFVPSEAERAKGKNEGAYAWENPPGLFDLAPLPRWLADLLRQPERAAQQKPAVERQRAADVSKRVNPWAQAALDDELRAVASAPEGTRNDRLNRAALNLAQLVAGGALEAALTLEQLRESAATAGLGAREAEATIQSGWKIGLLRPRSAPPERERGRAERHSAPDRGDSAREDGSHGSNGEPSEDAIALIFTSRFGGSLRFDCDTGRWHEWDGARWREDGTARAFHYARLISRDLGEGRRQICKASVAAGAERFARADPAHAVRSDVWDRDPMLLGTPIGTVDLRTGRLREPDPADGITKLTRAEPERGSAARWLEFLHDATNGDGELIRFMQQMCGYALTGDTREHALFFVHGPGGNGKSVFLNTVSRILGDYATTAAMDTFTASRGDRHSTELAMLRGARLVTASETEEGRAWAEARIKAMTGGDPITARFMRQDNFTFTPQFKLIIVGNHAPVLRNVDAAARRRFNIVPFTFKPPRPDRELEAKLAAEHGRILSWMIDGCLDWQRNGLTRPAAVDAATQSYFEEQDTFGQWLAERCTLGSREFELPARLLRDWRRFAVAAGEREPSAKALAAALRARGMQNGHTSCGSSRVWWGLSLRPDPAGHSEESS